MTDEQAASRGPEVTVAIHQPNYLPWLGYFGKVLRCDVFVFLDHVQMSVQSYTQRVQVLCQGAPQWLTVPIRKSGLFGQAICDVECNPMVPWARKHLGTLRASYGRHPHFDEVFPELRQVLESPPQRLALLNERLITLVAQRLGARCRFIASSSLAMGDLRSSELLAALVLKVGGTRYLYGGGAMKYQEAEPFDRLQVSAVGQGFVQVPYPQQSMTSFVPGLSVVDALFNLGYDGTRALLTHG